MVRNGHSLDREGTHCKWSKQLETIAQSLEVCAVSGEQRNCHLQKLWTWFSQPGLYHCHTSPVLGKRLPGQASSSGSDREILLPVMEPQPVTRTRVPGLGLVSAMGMRAMSPPREKGLERCGPREEPLPGGRGAGSGHPSSVCPSPMTGRRGPQQRGPALRRRHAS